MTCRGRPKVLMVALIFLGTFASHCTTEILCGLIVAALIVLERFVHHLPVERRPLLMDFFLKLRHTDQCVVEFVFTNNIAIPGALYTVDHHIHSFQGVEHTVYGGLHKSSDMVNVVN